MAELGKGLSRRLSSSEKSKRPADGNLVRLYLPVPWLHAPAAGVVTVLMIAKAVEELNFGMFSVYIMLFFGITYLLYGLAVTSSDIYPKWPGWVAVVLAFISFVVGAAFNLGGPSAVLINMLFSGVSTLLVVWTLVLGVLLWRKA